MKVQFKSWKCIAIGARYGMNGRKAIRLLDEIDNEPVATATIAIDDEDLPEDCVYIKEYSENSGITKALLEAKIINPIAIKMADSGHVVIFAYKITDQALEELWPEEPEGK